MPQPRKLDQPKLLALKAEGLTASEMQQRLANEGTSVSIDLVRKRLQEVRRASRGEPPTPKPTRKSSATVRRQGQVADALALVEALKEDLQGTLDGWGENFAGDRYERFQAAVESLEAAAEALEPSTLAGMAEPSKPIPRWDVHFGCLEDDRDDSTATHMTFRPRIGGHRPAGGCPAGSGPSGTTTVPVEAERL